MAAKPKEQLPRTRSGGTKWNAVAKHPLFIVIAVAVLGLASSLVVYQVQRPKPSLDESLTAIPDQPHTYSFTRDGRTISGESRSPFERGNGFYARVEACERNGFEGIYNMVTCYITIRPYVNMTISNSENPTSAIYDDGRPAVICCMYGEDFDTAPAYRIKLPAGDIVRRTYQRGSEVHVMINVPDADENHELDSISFSPGQGVAPTLFPIRDRTQDHTFSASFVRAHKDNPKVQKLVQDFLETKAKLKASKKYNRGLTYVP